jgi:nucleoside-diphosphate-sugar epimerase
MKTMKDSKIIFVAGASGATGRLLTDQLLKAGHQVRTVVRTPENLPDFLQNREGLTVTKGALLDLTEAELQAQVKDCDAIASCLGHNLTFRGVYLDPHRLVTNAVRRLCRAAIANDPDHKVRFILMNTAGNTNRDLNEPRSLGHKMLIFLLRWLLPPHADNEQAAEFLRTQIGQHHQVIEWAAVRPDGLVDLEEVTDYEIFESPIRDPLFDSGKTSRVNVANFMAGLATEEDLWEEWKGRMPLIYNQDYNAATLKDRNHTKVKTTV